MTKFTVILDACVLYPAPLRDLLVQLATTDIHRARWTAAIHDEWMRNVLANRSDLRWEQLEETRIKMNKNVRECLVTGYEYLVPSIALPDPDDRHVLAAAIRCHADAIVTFNLKDFPPKPSNPTRLKRSTPMISFRMNWTSIRPSSANPSRPSGDA